MINAPPMVLADHLTLVYVIAPQWEGPCKIGITNNLQRRLAGIQIGNAQPLTIFNFRLAVHSSGAGAYKSLAAATKAGARKLESAAHRVLRDCDLALSGEWFDVNVVEASQVLDKCGALSAVRSLTLEQVVSVDVDAGLDRGMASAQHKLTRALAAAATYVTGYQPNPIDE